MLRVVGRRACALGVVLALLSAPAVSGPSPAHRCYQCPSGCPMHARRVGCHHANGPRCHEAAAVGIRNACGRHTARGVPVPVFRGVLPLAAAARPAFTGSSLLRAVLARRTEPSPEPPTDPPRAPFVLA
ncbi:MAG: hypothetical protein E6J75_09530 [Deltaproteobacteria bacterium]|nr:MAG: hypothetical protein E6J75_09530 [Deltaproteobacteria bacterium]